MMKNYRRPEVQGEGIARFDGTTTRWVKSRDKSRLERMQKNWIRFGVKDTELHFSQWSGWLLMGWC